MKPHMEFNTEASHAKIRRIYAMASVEIISAQMVANALSLAAGTAHAYIRFMKDTGSLVRAEIDGRYQAGELYIPDLGKPHVKPAKHRIRRDPLVAAFFGDAQ